MFLDELQVPMCQRELQYFGTNLSKKFLPERAIQVSWGNQTLKKSSKKLVKIFS